MSSVTLKDIAVKLGVSHMTVSRAIRGSELIAEDTRRKVMKAVQDAGYMPHSSARSLNRGRIDAIGLLNAKDPSEAALPFDALWAMQMELNRERMHLTMGHIPDCDDPDDLPKVLREWSVDGLLINYTKHHPPALDRVLRRNRVPAIWINAKLSADCVHPDEFGAGRQATQRLIELGHRRIGITSFYTNDHFSYDDRFDGYRSAMLEAGLPLMDLRAEAYVVPARAQFGRDLLQRPDRPTALLTMGAREAESILTTALMLNLSVPRDLSLVCISNTPSSNTALDIATVVQSWPAVGVAAVQQLLTKIKAPRTALPPRLVPSDLVEGQTLAPPAIT